MLNKYKNGFILAAYFPFCRIIICKCIWACRMSSLPVGDLFVYLLFLPCGVNVSKIQMLTRSAWSVSVGIPAIWCSFLFPRKDYFCVSFMMCSLCADKIRNFLIEFLYDFCLLFRWLFATCIDFALLQLRCDFITTWATRVYKMLRVCGLPLPGGRMLVLSIIVPTKNFSGFITSFSLPQR